MISRFSFTPARHTSRSLILMGSLLISGAAALHAEDYKFVFGSGKVPSGFKQVATSAAYDAKLGYGFLEGATAPPEAARVFAVDVPEGNYDVTVRFGSTSAATSSTIKAESRRLMIEKVEVPAGKIETRTFTVNVRKPSGSTGTPSLNKRELGPPTAPDWDDHLTLEFNGTKPGILSVEIKPAAEALTIFLAGDSTVTDQPGEPWAGWGQMLPRFFQQGVAVSNQAESGLALYSFKGQKRLDKVLNMAKKGDYLFIQFGHNDQKDKSPNAGPFTSYKANLKGYIDAAKSKGLIPVLVTPMERRRWKAGSPEPTLADYAEAVRQTGSEEKVPVIDLNAMSLKLYTALGEDKSKKLFVFYPANTFPGQEKELADNTHHNTYGGYELARCMVEGIKTSVPELASRLAKDAGTFDPSKPDDFEKLGIPLSPSKVDVEKPAGN